MNALAVIGLSTMALGVVQSLRDEVPTWRAIRRARRAAEKPRHEVRKALEHMEGMARQPRPITSTVLFGITAAVLIIDGFVSNDMGWKVVGYGFLLMVLIDLSARAARRGRSVDL